MRLATREEDEEPMVDGATARAWLAREGFAEGDLRSEITIDDCEWFPMLDACYEGELGVCKWLHENGAAEDVTKANEYDETPMFLACQNGHLSVCKWLFEVGAAADMGVWPLLSALVMSAAAPLLFSHLHTPSSPS